MLLQAVARGLRAAVMGAFDDARVAGVVNMQKDERALYPVPVGRVRQTENGPCASGVLRADRSAKRRTLPWKAFFVVFFL